MGRRLLAFALTITLPAAALSAPLVHAHVDAGHGAQHASGRIHAHLDGHASHGARPHTHTPEGPALDDEQRDGLTVRIPAFVAAHFDVLIEPAIIPVTFGLPAATESVMRQPPQVVHSHGPPPGDTAGPRAPPSSSALI